MESVVKVIPIVVYADIPRAHDFLVEVFGFDAGGVQYDGRGPCTVRSEPAIPPSGCTRSRPITGWIRHTASRRTTANSWSVCPTWTHTSSASAPPGRR